MGTQLWPRIRDNPWTVDAASDPAAAIESDESLGASIKTPRASVD